ncbi:hypothetical protein F5148DRAFT_1279183 [Russula earlei]|uniref:Uncharacterized protein n=1 Tax=Russula earlei TaxID=71964 RepID=A0ACC0UQR1_9AGAM|nr:hypothetical protein F5148DRAFT_1279183 [Russula earlei]
MAASPVPIDRGDTQVREKWSAKEDRAGDSLAHGADLPSSNGGPSDERGASDVVNAEYHSRSPGGGDPGSGSRSGTTIYREKQVKRSGLVFTFCALQPNKVYIGGLPENTRQEDLQSCFGKIGSIVNIELKVGYGFVEFDSREAAEESVAKYNEGFFMGNKIRVEISRGGGRFAKFSGDPGACFKCGQMGHWARECPNHVVHTSRRHTPPADGPLIDRIHPPRDYAAPPAHSREYPPYREEYPPRGYPPPPRDARYPYDYPPPRRPASPPRDYRDYPPPPIRRGDIDDYRIRGPPPARYESRSGYYGSEDPVAYSRGYPPPASRDYDRYDRRPPPPNDRYSGYPPPPAVRPRTPPGGTAPPSRREEFERPPARDYAPPADYRRPVTPPSARYADYPARSGAEARPRRRSQSPPARTGTGTYEAYPTAPGYAGPPQPPKGAARDYPPRGGLDQNAGYRRQ